MNDDLFDITRADALLAVPHGFFGHGDGRHQFGYGASGDIGAIGQMRAAAADAIAGGARLTAPHQVHSPDVVIVDEGDIWSDEAEGRPVADAVVTARQGIVLGIVTADCAPVLFADVQAGVVGAAHAGWRGAHGGVLENTIAAMEHLGAAREQIAAAVGPTIAQASYEVDSPFRAYFQDEDARHFADAPPREGKPRWRFDLPGYVAARLATSLIKRTQLLDLDTFSTPARYYSYRRATLRGEPNYGRQISMIAAP